jgi:hypothetical protein
MKTTVEIPDALLEAAKQASGESDVSLRVLLERALQQELAERAERPRQSKRKDYSYGKVGLRPEFSYDNWAAIRDASYERDSGD